MSFTILDAVLIILALIIVLGLTYRIKGNGENLLKIGLKILTAGGGWVPMTVFIIHAFLSQVIHLYDLWSPADIPMHFTGGVAIAFFISRCFQLLPRESIKRSRIALLELLLIGSLTATAAVFWEFAEFSIDQLFGTNVQVSLANTMQDMAMGILGSIFLIAIRIRQLHIGTRELREITFDWVRGEAA
jgi:hypothetical protein